MSNSKSIEPARAVGAFRDVKSLWIAFQLWLISAFSMILAWMERARERRQLVSLNDTMLKDLGISRADAEREYPKPYWRR